MSKAKKCDGCGELIDDQAISFNGKLKIIERTEVRYLGTEDSEYNFCCVECLGDIVRNTSAFVSTAKPKLNYTEDQLKRSLQIERHRSEMYHDLYNRQCEVLGDLLEIVGRKSHRNQEAPT